MALLYFTTLRLFFFSAKPPLESHSLAGVVLLLGVSTSNILLALRRRSHYLLALALIMAYTTALVVGTTWFVFGLLLVLSVFVSEVRVRLQATGVMMTGITLTVLTHFVWAINNPILGNPLTFVTTPQVNIYLLLIYAVVFGVGVLRRSDHRQEDFPIALTSFLSAAGSYSVFLLLTLVS